MVFYRKYRSQTIAQLDNTKLRETLYRIFRKGNEYPHAFLFTGPKGLGKTSTARIIAKVINCENPVDSEGNLEPCNICNTCISITQGNNIDVLEIDGASNRGIDEIRDLRDKVRLAPGSAKEKVYIIDEVHMLTTEAFNALLKTIEEPPSHVVFIFCTTEPQKIPSTIISRCFHIALSPATQAELLRSFTRIVEGENLHIDPDALDEIARLANGGFRDGAKILEEIALMAKKQKITKAQVEKHFKSANITESINRFIDSIVYHDAKLGLKVIGDLVEQGGDVRYFITQVVTAIHAQMMHSFGINSDNTSMTRGIEVQQIQQMIPLLMKAYQDIQYAVFPQLPLEMFIIAWSERTRSATVNTPTESPSEKPTVTTLLKKQHAVRIQGMLSKNEKKPPTVATMRQSPISETQGSQKSLLENIIYTVKNYNHSLAAVLRSCTIGEMDDTKITFETAYKFHKERLDEIKGKETLEKVVKEITGKQLNVTIVLRDGEGKKQKNSILT